MDPNDIVAEEDLMEETEDESEMLDDESEDEVTESIIPPELIIEDPGKPIESTTEIVSEPVVTEPQKPQRSSEEIKAFNLKNFLTKHISSYTSDTRQTIVFSTDILTNINSLITITGFLKFIKEFNKNEENSLELQKEIDFIDSIIYKNDVYETYIDAKTRMFTNENILLLRYHLEKHSNEISKLILKYQSMMPTKKTSKHYEQAAGWGINKAESFEEEELDQVNRMGDAKQYLVDASGEVSPVHGE